MILSPRIISKATHLSGKWFIMFRHYITCLHYTIDSCQRFVWSSVPSVDDLRQKVRNGAEKWVSGDRAREPETY